MRVPSPFPSCVATKKITVAPNSDCMGAPDTSRATARCDLAAGMYGDLDVQNDSKLTLKAGPEQRRSLLRQLPLTS